MFRKRQASQPQTVEEHLAAIRSHSQGILDATELRNEAIRATRFRGGPTLEEVAEAAGLTVSRVKQLRSGPEERHFGRANGDPITDLDLPFQDADAPKRVWGILDIAPDIEIFDSERAFLESGRNRYGSDLGWDYYDIDRNERFVISTAGNHTGGLDIYAFLAGSNDGKSHGPDGFSGSSSGPCYLLGNVPTTWIADKLIFPPLQARTRRPGALAWAYTRILTINEVITSVQDQVGTSTRIDIRQVIGKETPAER